MAKSFIKSNWQKDAGETAINAGLRGAGAFAGAFIINKWFSGEPADGKEKQAASESAKTMKNIGGPVMLAIGVLGDMMLEEPKLRCVCQGLTTYALLHSAAVIAPDTLAKKIGVSGLAGNPEEDAALMSGIGVLGETSEAYTGNSPEEFALAQGEQTVNDTDGKTYNNDWQYLAENIDNADQITRAVNGLGESEAEENADLMGTDDDSAALMGTDDAEEATLLMGMF